MFGHLGVYYDDHIGVLLEMWFWGFTKSCHGRRWKKGAQSVCIWLSVSVQQSPSKSTCFKTEQPIQKINMKEF